MLNVYTCLPYTSIHRASTFQTDTLLPSSTKNKLATHLSLRRKSKTRAALGLVEDSVNSLEEDVAKDRELKTVVGLDTSEALSPASGSEVNVAAGDDESLAVDGDVEVGESGGAGEDVAALVAVVRCAGDARVVVVDDVVGEEEEGGAGIGDGGADGAAAGGGGADAVAAGVELPEAVGAVDGGVGDGSGVFGAVDEAKVVGAGGALPQVGGEELLLEGALDGVEEGGLLVGRDGVDAAERQAEQTVVVDVLGELSRDGGCGFNCLRGRGDRANDDLVGVDIAAGAGAVAVADLPALSRKLPSRSRWVVPGVARRLAGWGLG
jgi:hypothetical protein